MRPPEELKREIVRQWFAKAEQDMRAGEALLTWHQIESPKTHAIEQLLDLVKDAEPETASSLRDAVALTPYGVDIRYPGDQPEPNLEEAREAVELARRVRDAVMDRLGKIQ